MYKNLVRLSILGIVFALAQRCAGSGCTGSLCKVRRFPDEFLFGTATGSYQVEGAWQADGKTESIWDHFTHTKPEAIKDGSNGDVADNSYYLYKRDVEMLRKLGVDFYRFSLSWTRILPTGFPDKINEAGVAYYNNLINELLKYNIQPIVTIYHWDLPQKLQELGGWANPYIVNWYADYARTVFELFGDRVKYWITINEPHVVCYYSYGNNLFAPAIDIKGVADYMCAKNVLLAHANAYHIYDEEFRWEQNGIIFISLVAQWYEPLNQNQTKAAFDANQFEWGQYSHPIFSKTGDFPPVMKERIAARSAEQGFPRSRLPELTKNEVDFIRGSSDLFGLNHYYTKYAFRNESAYGHYESPSFEDDLAVFYRVLPEWTIGESNYTKFVPWGLYELLTEIREEYDNPPVFITENGFASHGGLDDKDRVTYFTEYLSAMLDAMEEGSDVRGYTAWTLMDNFEWNSGYTRNLYENGGVAILNNTLRVQYNNAFRMLLVLPRFCSASGMFAENRVDCFYTIMRKRCGSLVRRLRSSSNSILSMIADRLDCPEKFGLYEVDFSSPELTRTPRRSAYVMKELFRSRALDRCYEPDMSIPMTIN